MRSYPALTTISLIIKIATVVGGSIGVLESVYVMSNSENGTYSGFVLGGLILAITAVAALFSWAQSELILLFVNMGQDVSRLVESSGARLQDEKTSPGIAPTGSGSIQSEHPTSGASPTDAQLCPNCIYVHVEAPGPNGYFCGRWSKWVKSDNTCGEFERRPQAAHPA